jgi:hypothetical protein
MSTFMMGLSNAWGAWASVFSPLPYGDPYVAAFGLVFILIWSAKVLMKGGRRL